MIRSVADKETVQLLATGKSKRLPPAILRRALLRLNQLDHAKALDDMRFPPANHLEALKGDRVGQWSVRINDQWRLCFRFVDGDAFDVEIVDYH
ncbi:type II toxin-antitoxin system RelE/ParE family toxin [Arenimonas daejeonensis]|uniref:type II toxin-antitoxin system RelE/ParE family toxin n=1 Tax=Arenimonas daejeonensis TaxID=370777 RepID=UPI0011BFB829|nr:type II toxin-antitoxin system RelE/ParE family toxin [Arenimonas daejeonensis]